jgi:hypothetical protein
MSLHHFYKFAYSVTNDIFVKNFPEPIVLDDKKAFASKSTHSQLTLLISDVKGTVSRDFLTLVFSSNIFS